MQVHWRFLTRIALLCTLLIVVALSATVSWPMARAVGSAGALPAEQATPTVAPDSASEIGSTDGIVLAGIVLLLIVFVPVILYRFSGAAN